jgi:hypothetical protein
MLFDWWQWYNPVLRIDGVTRQTMLFGLSDYKVLLAGVVSSRLAQAINARSRMKKIRRLVAMNNVTAFSLLDFVLKAF